MPSLSVVHQSVGVAADQDALHSPVLRLNILQAWMLLSGCVTCLLIYDIYFHIVAMNSQGYLRPLIFPRACENRPPIRVRGTLVEDMYLQKSTGQHNLRFVHSSPVPTASFYLYELEAVFEPGAIESRAPKVDVRDLGRHYAFCCMAVSSWTFVA
jgi:hypothetical protein